ncbi:MAG: hypothetical protein V2A79_16535 [Planctomycetota bacterium]
MRTGIARVPPAAVAGFLVAALGLAGAAEPEMPKVPAVEKAPAVDGDLGDEGWKQAPVLKFEGYCDQARRDKGDRPRDATEARLLTDRENLYVAFRCEETHPDGPWLCDDVNDPLKKRNYPVLAGDYAALCLDLGRFGFHNYYIFAVSPKGEVYRCFTWPHRYDLVLTDVGLPAVQGAAKMDKAGTCWTAELKIPLKDLLRYPADGVPSLVGADLRRVQWGDDRGKQKFTVYWTGHALVEGGTGMNLQYDHMATWKPLFEKYPDYNASYACSKGWVQLIFPESFGPLNLEIGKIDNRLVSGQGANLIGHVEARAGWDLAQWDRLAKDFDAPRMEQWDDLRPEHPAGKPEVVMTEPVRKAGQTAGFAAKPAVTTAGAETHISFGASGPADCAVAILDAQGKVVRHLAAGVLGKNAPEPLKKDSLVQDLAWDRRDDSGKPVPPGIYRAQVSLGLAAKFDHAIALDKATVDEDKYPKGLDVDHLPTPPDLSKAWPPSHSGYSAGGINFLSLDRARGELYVQERYVYEGASGKFLREIKVAGPPGSPFGAWHFDNGEIAIGPDGLLYISGSNEIWRFDREGKPVPFEALGRCFIPDLWGAHSNPHRGICVAPNGDIYKSHHYQPHMNFAQQITRLGPDGRIKKYGFIEMRCCSVGVKVDRRGNVYVGGAVQPPGALPPRDLADKLPKELLAKYPRLYGSILKFGPEGGIVKPDPKGEMVCPGPKGMRPYAVQGAEWIHPGFSPMLSRVMDNQGGPGCACRNGRFDLDDFGRLFIPDAVGGRVEVTDANANTIMFIGARGKAGEAAGIELGWPTVVAACDRALYIADYLRYRVVRVKLEYDAEETCDLGPVR